MTVQSNQLIGASFQHTNVSVWVVDIGKLKPFNGDLTPLVEPIEQVPLPAIPVQEPVTTAAASAPANPLPPPSKPETLSQPPASARYEPLRRSPPKQRKNTQHWEQKGPTQQVKV